MGQDGKIPDEISDAFQPIVDYLRKIRDRD